VLTYVMHNHGETHDREFNSTIVAVSPEETEFAVDMQYAGPDGKTVYGSYHRHQSRRELLGARTIDHGSTCNPADTLDTRYRGSTLLMASQRVLRLLKQGETVDVHMWYTVGCSQGTLVSGTLHRVEDSLVPVSILLDGRRLDLSTIHARGQFSSFAWPREDVDYWFLDDDQMPWMIRVEGKQGQTTYMQQLGRVVGPSAEQDLAKALSNAAADKACHVPIYGIYFGFASADLKPASAPALQQIAAVMKQHADWTLTIEGHTDSIGGAASNLDLSNRRAAAVKDELVRRYGVPAARLATQGYGLTRPLAPNGTMEGRAQNRRVELSRKC
jgi:outer membrane protein OmpA-like peptidoglycan-associated protein